MNYRCIAVDWSGRKSGERRHIWLAEAANGSLRRLESGRTRDGVIAHLIEQKQAARDFVVGLDFGFSFPEWFLEEGNFGATPNVWNALAAHSEDWLKNCQPPFWGRPKTRKPTVKPHFRQTEEHVAIKFKCQPKSVFQVGGAGAVGTGSLRGLPFLAQLRDAGFCVWPFEPPQLPLVLEIYPRALTGKVVKSSAVARSEYIKKHCSEMASGDRGKCVTSEDAFDAAISALKMSECSAELADLPVVTDVRLRREGWIWYPGTTLK